MLHSGIQQGTIKHLRIKPKRHSFTYPVFMSLLDVDEIGSIFKRSRLWSIGRFNLISFHRDDYIQGDEDIYTEVKQRIADGTGRRFNGKVYLLTHLRYLGFCFNPVSFYFCYEKDRTHPEFILAEVNNTPWNERHCYVLECSKRDGEQMEFTFPKQFHVSPFMPMDLEYRWRVRLRDGKIVVEMALYEEDSICFRVILDLAHEPITASSMRRVPIRYPFITMLVLFRIYWQALRLWLKRVPIHDHPKHEFNEVNYEHDR